MLIIVWHLLRYDVEYADLGTDYYPKRRPRRPKNRLLRQLHQLGYDAELTRLAA